mmetsp:Transcript_19803/g.55040  ORF Transcript_19803/g.55040 Transcript_19803/m.55040 type:complete len:303 (-) Transcript_19803:220-1128(-)
MTSLTTANSHSSADKCRLNSCSTSTNSCCSSGVVLGCAAPPVGSAAAALRGVAGEGGGTSAVPLSVTMPTVFPSGEWAPSPASLLLSRPPSSSASSRHSASPVSRASSQATAPYSDRSGVDTSCSGCGGTGPPKRPSTGVSCSSCVRGSAESSCWMRFTLEMRSSAALRASNLSIAAFALRHFCILLSRSHVSSSLPYLGKCNLNSRSAARLPLDPSRSPRTSISTGSSRTSAASSHPSSALSCCSTSWEEAGSESGSSIGSSSSLLPSSMRASASFLTFQRCDRTSATVIPLRSKDMHSST